MVGENAPLEHEWAPVVKCCGSICTEVNCPTCGVFLSANVPRLSDHLVLGEN